MKRLWILSMTGEYSAESVFICDEDTIRDCGLDPEGEILADDLSEYLGGPYWEPGELVEVEVVSGHHHRLPLGQELRVY